MMIVCLVLLNARLASGFFSSLSWRMEEFRWTTKRREASKTTNYGNHNNYPRTEEYAESPGALVAVPLDRDPVGPVLPHLHAIGREVHRPREALLFGIRLISGNDGRKRDVILA